MFSKLIGSLSRIRFPTVADRYIGMIGSGGSSLKETKLEMLIWSMRYFKLQIYPMNALEETADFLEITHDLFQKATGRIKYTYTYVFKQLLEPIAAIATAEVNFPRWFRTIESIYSVAHKMLGKNNPQVSLYSFLCTLLCVARKEFFLKTWPDFMNLLMPKFSDPFTNELCMTCIAQITWVYLFRCWESPGSLVEKRMLTVTRLVMPQRREPLHCDPDIVTRILYFMLAKLPEFVCEQILLPLLQMESSFSPEALLIEEGFNSIEKAEHAINVTIQNPERMALIFRSFLLLINDAQDSLANTTNPYNLPDAIVTGGSSNVIVESKLNVAQPKFPDSTPSNNFSIETLESIRRRNGESCKPLNSELPQSVLNAMGTTLKNTLSIINEHCGKVLVVYFEAVGHWDFFDYMYNDTGDSNSGSGTVSQPKNPRAEALVGLNSLGLLGPIIGPGMDTYLPERVLLGKNRVMLDLLHVVLDSLPRYAPVGVTPVRLLEILSRLLFHVNESIQKSARNALFRIAHIKEYQTQGYDWSKGLDNQSLAGAVSQIPTKHVNAFLVQRYKELWSVPYHMLSVAFARLSLIFISTLEIWLEDIRQRRVAGNATESPKEIEVIVQGIEVRGLVLLIQREPVVRANGLKVLELAAQFEKELSISDKKQVASDNLSADLDMLKHLADFHGGRESVLMQRQNKVNLRPGKQFRCSIDIIKDMEHALVSKHFRDPLSESSWFKRDSDAKHKLLDEEHPLIHIIGSENSSEIAIWNRCVPTLFKTILEHNQKLLPVFLSEVWTRVSAIHGIIITISEESTRPSRGDRNAGTASKPGGAYTERRARLRDLSASEKLMIVEQWRLFITVIVSSRKDAVPTRSNSMPSAKTATSERKSSSSPFSLFTVQVLLHQVLPLLGSPDSDVRSAISTSLGSIHSDHYSCLLTELKPFLEDVVSDIKVRFLASTAESSKTLEGKRMDSLRTELAKLLALTSDFIREENIRTNKILMTPLSNYIRAMHQLFTHKDVEFDWVHQKSRNYFSMLCSSIFNHVVHVDRNWLEEMIPLKLRLGLLVLFQDWCGHGPQSHQIREREIAMTAMVMDGIKDIEERTKMAVNMEYKRKFLGYIALQALASILKHPVPPSSSVNIDSKLLLDMMTTVLSSTTRKHIPIAVSTLFSLLSLHAHESIYVDMIRIGLKTDSESVVYAFLKAFDMHASTKAVSNPERLLAFALIMCGNSAENVRMAAAHLVLTIVARKRSSQEFAHDVAKMYQDLLLEQDEDGAIETQEGEISMTFETLAVSSSHPIMYRHAQLEISERLAESEPELAYAVCLLMQILSEYNFWIQERYNASGMAFSSQMHTLLNLQIPWLKQIELAGDFSLLEGDVDDASQGRTWAVLNNLVYVTLLFGDAFIDEIVKMWGALVDMGLQLADVTGDVELQRELSARLAVILDYCVFVSLEQQHQRWIMLVQKVSICISRTTCSNLFVDLVISKLEPNALVAIPRKKLQELRDLKFIPPPELHLATLSDLDTPPTKAIYSAGQLYFFMLVNIVMETAESMYVHIPLLLHIVFVQLDQSQAIAEQARTLLVHLIQALRSEVPEQSSLTEGVLTALYLTRGKRAWENEDITPTKSELQSTRKMEALLHVVLELVSVMYPQLRQAWGETALAWARECKSRHDAGRSLQVYQILDPSFSSKMLGDVILCLSMSINSSQVQLQGYAIDVLNTLLSMAKHQKACAEHPQIFWAACTGLMGDNDMEYLGCLKIIEAIAPCLTTKQEQESVMVSMPPMYKGFDGLMMLLMRGLYRPATHRRTLQVIQVAMQLPSGKLLGAEALACVTVAFLQATVDGYPGKYDMFAAVQAYSQEHPLLSRLYQGLEKRQFNNKTQILTEYAKAVKTFSGRVMQYVLQWDHPTVKRWTEWLGDIRYDPMQVDVEGNMKLVYNSCSKSERIGRAEAQPSVFQEYQRIFNDRVKSG